MKYDHSRDASKETPYFVYDGEMDDFYYFSNEAERDEYTDELIHDHCNDGWSEGVTNIVAGKVTHTTVMTDKVETPDDPEFDYKCDYKLKVL